MSLPVGGRASVLFFVLVSIGRFASAQEASRNRSVSDRLIGACRLVSVETKRGNGEVISPFYGRHPQGLLIYDRSGWMSVHIVSGFPRRGCRSLGGRSEKGDRRLLVFRTSAIRPLRNFTRLRDARNVL
jgi:hypothetical protein